MDPSQTVQYTALISGITKQVESKTIKIPSYDISQARSMVRNIDTANELTFLRIRYNVFIQPRLYNHQNIIYYFQGQEKTRFLLHQVRLIQSRMFRKITKITSRQGLHSDSCTSCCRGELKQRGGDLQLNRPHQAPSLPSLLPTQTPVLLKHRLSLGLLRHLPSKSSWSISEAS